ncbi:MAG: hypothetical protein RBT60_02610 [Candidatus Krumholzibacteria bacterium]|jgi:hypothetical protein|nr:hypothetical protein [Candidatus Krumholzibacteria bacterium]
MIHSLIRLRLQILFSLMVLVGAAGPAAAKSTWVSIRDLHGGQATCLDIGGTQQDYVLLDAGTPVRTTVQGPRRLKLITRYVFDADDRARTPYTVIVAVDGAEVLRKSFTGQTQANAAVCQKADQRIGVIRRGYLDIPAGRHEVTLRAETEGHGRVATRVFRLVRRQPEAWVTFAPEGYQELRHLQFESGAQSVYYHFAAGSPLRLTLNGPTTLRLGTRLDFDHTMNGSQNYALQVTIDDEVWRTFHFDATALTAAHYIERSDLLPGVRKELRIAVPRGRHKIEIHCVRPEVCGVAAMIHIPKRDVQR